MPEIRSFGLKSVKIGDVGASGGMGQTLALLGDGNTLEGTASFIKEEDEEVEFYAEERDDAIETIMKKGASILEFGIVDFTAATLVKVLGGTDNAGVWEAPDVAPEIEQSIEVITKKDVKIEIVRAKISASIDWPLSKEELGKVTVRAKVLAPTLADTPAYQISDVSS
jgi:hypothetical protein